MLRRHFTSYLQSNNDSGLTFDFVDLGLSVMWASCNLGASSPEEPGLFYSWGEVEGHRLSADGVTFEDGHVFSQSNYQTPMTTTRTASLQLSNDAVYQKLSTHPNHAMLKFRMPTYSQYDELIKNTTSTLSTVNGVPVYILTSIVNGNTLTIPIAGSFFAQGTNNTYFKSYTYLWGTSHNAESLNGVDNSMADVYNYSEHSFVPKGGIVYNGSPIRGVCDYQPLSDFLYPGEKCEIIKDKVYAVRCEHGLEIPFTGTVYLSATPEFTEFVTIEAVELLQLTPLDLTHYVNNILYKTGLPTSLSPELYCYIKFNADDTSIYNFWNTQYYNNPLLYNGMKLSAKYSSSKSVIDVRIKYNTIFGKSLTINNIGNSKCSVGISNATGKNITSTNTSLAWYGIIKSDDSATITPDIIASWSTLVDDNGYIYMGIKGNTSSTNANIQIQIDEV